MILTVPKAPLFSFKPVDYCCKAIESSGNTQLSPCAASSIMHKRGWYHFFHLVGRWSSDAIHETLICGGGTKTKNEKTNTPNWAWGNEEEESGSWGGGDLVCDCVELLLSTL